MSISEVLTYSKRVALYLNFSKIMFSIKKWDTDLNNGTNLFMEYWARIFEEPFKEIHFFFVAKSTDNMLWLYFGGKFLKDLGDIKFMNSDKDLQGLRKR